MIKSKAFQALTTTSVLLPVKTGRTYVGIQNHDVSNPVVATLGGADAVLSPPNGVNIGAGEFLELQGDLEGIVNIIASTGAVDITILFNR